MKGLITVKKGNNIMALVRNGQVSSSDKQLTAFIKTILDGAEMLVPKASENGTSMESVKPQNFVEIYLNLKQRLENNGFEVSFDFN